MDPVSLIFSTFLNLMTNSVHSHVNDVMGVELQANIVEYQGQKIDFQYQMWQIRPASVCSRSRQSLINEYSACTTAAKQMFEETCQHLNKHPKKYWQHSKLKNMYCNAAVSYMPVTASISRPDPSEAERLEARQACSLLILKTRESRSPDIQKQREEACELAKQLEAYYQ